MYIKKYSIYGNKATIYFSTEPYKNDIDTLIDMALCILQDFPDINRQDIEIVPKLHGNTVITYLTTLVDPLEIPDDYRKIVC